MLVYAMRAIKEPGSTPVTSGRVIQAIDSYPVRMFLVNYANLYVASQGHGLYVHVWSLCSESRMD